MEKENWSCPMCAMYGNHHWVHIVIKIAVALIIFWAGVQFGELKGMLHGGYGYRMMGSRVGNYSGQNMMYRGTSTIVIPPTKTTATTTKK